jgi:hypothetical protein
MRRPIEATYSDTEFQRYGIHAKFHENLPVSKDRHTDVRIDKCVFARPERGDTEPGPVTNLGLPSPIRAGRPGFDSRQGQDFSLLHSVHTGYGAHPAFYPMGTGDKAAGV